MFLSNKRETHNERETKKKERATQRESIQKLTLAGVAHQNNNKALEKTQKSLFPRVFLSNQTHA